MELRLIRPTHLGLNLGDAHSPQSLFRAANPRSHAVVHIHAVGVSLRETHRPLRASIRPVTGTWMIPGYEKLRGWQWNYFDKSTTYAR